MKILIMEDEKLLKPPLPEALVILDVTAPGINSRQVAEEVETCIHSLLHRQEEETEALSFGNTSLELSTGMLRCGMKHVQLSAKEFEILRLLFQSGRKNLSKETILQKVWGYDTDAVENNVEVYVGFLRKKLARTAPTCGSVPSAAWDTIWRYRRGNYEPGKFILFSQAFQRGFSFG